MKNKWLFVLAMLFVCGCNDVIVSGVTVPSSIDGDGTVVFIVYDSSGSMDDNVINSQNIKEEKHNIANRALITVGKRFDNYLSANTNRTLGVGIVIAGGGVTFDSFKVMKYGVEKYFSSWAKRQSPGGGTPLGNAMNLAAENMIKVQNVKNCHIIVLTDGRSNFGPNPDQVLPTIKQNFKKKGIEIGVHLIAFDVGSELFGELKKMGATVLGAANEVELNSQFDLILREKILLEKEE